MTLIDKYPLDRLRGKGLALSVNCPYCQGTRIEIKNEKDLDPFGGVRCFKCKALIVLDALSLTVIRERASEG